MVGLTIGVTLGLAVAYLAVTPRMYSATAQFLVLQQGERPISVAGPDAKEAAVEDYIPTQVLIVNSQQVVRDAIASVGLEHLPTLAAVKRRGLDPVDKAIEHLTVTRPDRLAKLIRVTYWARSRGEAIRTVDAIAVSYKRFLGDSFRRQNGETIELITKAKDQLSIELEQCQTEYREFRQQNKTLVVDEHGRSPMIMARLEQLYRADSDARIKEIQLGAQLALGRDLAKQDTALWAIANAVEQAGSGPSSAWIANAVGTPAGTTQDYMRQLGQDQQRLAERYGSDNAKVQSLKDQIQRVHETAHTVRHRLESGEVRDLLASYEGGLKSLTGARAEFGREIAIALAEFKNVEDKTLVESNLREIMERRRSLFNKAVDQLKQAQYVGDHSNIMPQIVEAPHSPVGRSGPTTLWCLVYRW